MPTSCANRRRISSRRIVAIVIFISLAVATILLSLSGRTGKGQYSSEDVGLKLETFAGSGMASVFGSLEAASEAVVKEASAHGHNWIPEMLNSASVRSQAPWTGLRGSVLNNEVVVDSDHEVLLTRLEGLLSVVSQACGNLPGDFSAHITPNRGINAYSLADGGIYLSYMLAASGTDDQIAFALAHEIRHLRACHYSHGLIGRWTVAEPHEDAFAKLDQDGSLGLLEPRLDYYAQELECDAYAAFITAYCGFDPASAVELLDMLPEADGRTYPTSSERKKRLADIIACLDDEEFLEGYLPARLLDKQLKELASTGADGADASSPYGPTLASLRRDAAALDAHMRPAKGTGVDMSAFTGLFQVVIAVRLEASSPFAVTADVALTISSKGLSGMAPAAIVQRALMLRTDEGWRLAAAFDTPGRAARWNSWMGAEDKLPMAKPKEKEARFASDALSAWKASFVTDAGLHALCYSSSEVAPYLENEGLADRSLDMLELSGLFSSLEQGASMRVFDLTVKRAGKDFVSLGFGYLIEAGGFPVLAGNCRLGMVPERGGWAVAGVSMY